MVRIYHISGTIIFKHSTWIALLHCCLSGSAKEKRVKPFTKDLFLQQISFSVLPLLVISMLNLLFLNK